MAKAEKLPSGNWRVRIQYYDELGNRHHKSITGKTEAEALYKAEKETVKLQTYKPEDSDLTLAAAIIKYTENHSRRLSPTTIRLYKGYPKSFFPEIMNRQIGRLTEKLIQRAIDHDYEHSPKSIHNVAVLVCTVMREFQGVELHLKLPKLERDIRPIPSLKDLGTILRASEDTRSEIALHLAAYLGLRMSELVALKYKDIHENKIMIQRAIVRGENGLVEKNNLKNATSRRTIALPPELLQKIMNEYSGDPEQLIVKPSRKEIETDYKRILKLHNMPPYRLHDLRHVNASIMLRLNVPTKYQMTRGGWATDQILKTVYQHTMADYESEIDDQIYNFIDDLKKQ